MCRLAREFGRLGTAQGAPAAFGMSFGLSARPEDDGAVARLVKIADERLLLHKRDKNGLHHPGPPAGSRRAAGV
jgi:hypothetical protein